MVSEQMDALLDSVLSICLNPCCCGRWSQRKNMEVHNFGDRVLILVVVEDGLRGVCTK